MTDKLLPCPFCGGAATADHQDNGVGSFWIVCDNVKGGCGCEGPYHQTPEDAEAAWNRRSPPPETNVAGDAAEHALEVFKDRMWREGEIPAMRAAIQSTWPEPHLLHIAVAAVLEADTEFRSNLPKGWEGDPLSDEIDGLRRIFEAAPAPQDHVAGVGLLPIYAEGGIGARLMEAMEAYRKDYVFSPDDGWDHDPTEFEKLMLEDFLNGAFNEQVTAILQEAARAAVPKAFYMEVSAE